MALDPKLQQERVEHGARHAEPEAAPPEAALLGASAGATRAPTRAGLWFSLLALGLAGFHAGWLEEPLSTLQLNAGNYFGVFVKNWEQFGFWQLRGLPLMSQLVAVVGDGVPYVHHPPGLSWLFYALGGEEWSMRLPTVVASFVAAVCWYRITRLRFSPAASFWSANLLAFSPCMSVISQASYEPLVIACGLIVISELLRPVRDRRLSLALLCGAAFVGTWIDWGFAFLGLASIPPTLARWGISRGIRRLIVPGATAVLAVVTIALWSQWALAAPGVVPPPSEDRDIAAMAQRFMLADRPSIGWYFDHLSVMIPKTWSWWLFGTFVVGIGFALRRFPSLTIAAVMVAIAPYTALKQPSDYVWQTFAVLMIAVAAAGILHWALAAGTRWVATLAACSAVVVLAGTVHASWMLRANAASSYFERLGAVLSEVANEPGHGVSNGYLYSLPYYFDSPRIELAGRFFPEQLAPFVAQTGGLGWKYLWLKPVKPGLIHPGMEGFLAQFPRTRVPELEGELDVEGQLATGGIAEAWLYTLSEPPK